MKPALPFLTALLLLSLLLSPSQSLAAKTLVVDNQSPTADDSNPGTETRPLKTIDAAAQLAEPGDTVLVRAGVYRERVAPARGGTAEAPIVYQAAPGERVEVKGSEAWSAPWTPDPSHPRLFFSAIPDKAVADIPNPYRIGISISGGDGRIRARPVAEDALNKPWPRTLGQVFVQGDPLTQVETLDQLRRLEGSWIVSADGATLHVHLPGAQAPDVLLPTVEWSVRNRIFAPRRRGLAHIHVRGFIFLHCANQGPFPQGGAVSPRTGRNWVFDGNTIRFAKTIGLDIGSETWDAANLDDTVEEDRRLMVQAGHIVRNNTISDNGLCGIAGWSAKNCRIYNNLLERNNRLNFSLREAGWEEWAAIKLHATDAVIAGNTIRDNEASGIWIDNDYHMSRITGNVLIGNRLAGIKMELGAGSVLIDNNIVAHTRDGGFYDGNGIYSHDAAGLTVAHNLLFENAGAGVLMRTITGRTYGGKPVKTSNNRIVNNVFYNNAKGAISLPFENPRSSGNFSDRNLFVGSGAFFSLNKYQDTFTWEEVWAKLREADLKPGEAGTDAQGEGEFRRQSLDAWRAVTGWDRNSVTADAPGGWTGWSVLPHRMLLRMNVPPEWPAMRCPAVDEMTADFRGDDMATDAFEQDIAKITALPGPFQDLAAGGQETALTPVRNMQPPALRAGAGAREAAARMRRFERLQAAVPPPAANEPARRFSLTDALGPEKKDADRWFNALQEGVNPGLTTTFGNLREGPVDSMYMQSPSGPSSSPGPCLLFKVPEAGHYKIDLAVFLQERQHASAGVTAVTLFQIDGAFENAREVRRVGLNTPDGYQGNTLRDRAELKEILVCPADSYIVLRFQIVAPGPAAAGIGRLGIARFDVTRLGHAGDAAGRDDAAIPSLRPVRWLSAGSSDALLERRFQRLQATVPRPVADKPARSFALADSLGPKKQDADRWFNALQEGVNPELTTTFSNLKAGPISSMHAQSGQGVSSSPGPCLLFKVPEAGHYEVDLDVALTNRGSASAGVTAITLFQIDGAFENVRFVRLIELNTRDGYRGETLSDRAKWKELLVCPADSHIVLRFQIVAPGPAAAGIGRLGLERFNVTQLR